MKDTRERGTTLGNRALPPREGTRPRVNLSPMLPEYNAEDFPGILGILVDKAILRCILRVWDGETTNDTRRRHEMTSTMTSTTQRTQIWIIDGGTVELSVTPTERGAIYWIDQRNVWGRLESSESFPSEQAAREWALALVDADTRNSGISFA